MSSTSSQRELSAQFRGRHFEGTPLVLANVWDASSACLMQSLGAEAIATTSAGVAWALGYADGHALPVSQHIAAVERIARVLDRPLTVDVENGYSDDPREVADNVAKFIDAGAVGINIEDGRDAPTLLCKKIEVVKAMIAKRGVDLFVNVRTDVFLQQLTPGREVAETLQRASQYATAGADGLFVPLVRNASDIDTLVRGQTLPLNAMACPGLPTLAELSRLGVRRLSAGSAIAHKAWAMAKLTAATFLAEGSTESLFTDSVGFGEINALFVEP
jgi:2-methylisocitrate lyase-like PEP mutase family enzyme